MKAIRLSLIFLVAVFLLIPNSAIAQSYLFSLDVEVVNIYWNEDGTSSIDYLFVFTNDPSGAPIAYVDVGLPNSSFDSSSISADVDGNTLSDISVSGYQATGSGVAVGLGQYAIPPGESGRVHVFIGTVRRVLYPDDQDSAYASAVFSPTYFGSQYVRGTTNLQLTFHLPPGVLPEEPRWHSAPKGFPDQPETNLDEQGRVMYTWSNPQASASNVYEFGASFPAKYVPESSITRPSFLESLGLSSDDLFGITCCLGFGGFFALIIGLSYRGAQSRKLQYLPPKVAIEGHGIKRGLTAVEAAILLEQPLEKILTMTLFSTIKKGAASVLTREPLEISVTQPTPEGLQPYEEAFLKAFEKKDIKERRKDLQVMMIDLVKSVSNKMKGFSRRETIAYYRDIIKRAWAQVETADTPEVKSVRFDEVMEWTMLD